MKKINFDQEINETDTNTTSFDRGPVDLNATDIVDDENTEMTSLLPTNIDQKKESEIIAENISNTHQWRMDNNPLNEINTEFLANLPFSCLFPDARGNPTME